MSFTINLVSVTFSTLCSQVFLVNLQPSKYLQSYTSMLFTCGICRLFIIISLCGCIKAAVLSATCQPDVLMVIGNMLVTALTFPLLLHRQDIVFYLYSLRQHVILESLLTILSRTHELKTYRFTKNGAKKI